MTRDLLPELPDGAFAKQDGGDDLAFYAPARLVTHIDGGAVAAPAETWNISSTYGAACESSPFQSNRFNHTRQITHRVW